MRTYVNISNLVTDILNRKKLRASQFARKIGVSHATVGRWKKGDDIPNPRSCYKLSKYTHTSIEEILRIAGYVPRTNKR